ncbi:MAG: hypothetical protein U0892_12580 [Pirellulales bacterium]
MRKLLAVTAILWVLSLSSGCGVIRSFEQWKCDRLGMCHFGTQPSMMAAPPCDNCNAFAPGIPAQGVIRPGQ